MKPNLWTPDALFVKVAYFSRSVADRPIDLIGFSLCMTCKIVHALLTALLTVNLVPCGWSVDHQRTVVAL
ncbi:hypothetical protein T4E_2040 [Trichinella pseudospiralis]|uniref:Uncharacterized protein n=1 Tax=Trichinella pseudospiralis TaxID=6337 RepID=A0A0V0YMA5_TRIPS|nr:hypothetical protein T4E_2040 [Trichinella pseudospiralis]